MENFTTIEIITICSCLRTALSRTEYLIQYFKDDKDFLKMLINNKNELNSIIEKLNKIL